MEKPHTYIGKKYKDFKGDVIEFGCGDGNNIKYFKSFNSYTFSDYEFKLFDEQNIHSLKVTTKLRIYTQKIPNKQKGYFF